MHMRILEEQSISLSQRVDTVNHASRVPRELVIAASDVRKHMTDSSYIYHLSDMYPTKSCPFHRNIPFAVTDETDGIPLHHHGDGSVR